MAITGSQHALTPARAGVLRSGAGRSGWPLVVGSKVKLYALSNIARSGATRSNYHSPKGFVAIGGVHIATGPALAGEKIVGDLTISDGLNDIPNRATFRVRGVIPRVGQDVVVTLGSKNTLTRLFAGQILVTTLGYVGAKGNTFHDVSAIDWTWGLQHKTLAQQWATTSATTIAQQILAAAAPGISGQYIAPGLPILDEFTVTNVPVPSALSQLAKRIGGYWYIDYHRRLHLYVGDDPEPLTPPTPLTPIHPTLSDLTVDRDGSQLVTRVYVEGGGSTALAVVMPGETVIPVQTGVWYEAGGGMVMAGPQRIRYASVLLGQGGSLVGPGASPASAAKALVTGGAGIEAGAHDYAIAFVTATGESLVSPRVSVTVGAVAPPATGLVVGSVGPGNGPEPGEHAWAVTFLTPTGETTAGPLTIKTVAAGMGPPLAGATGGTPGYAEGTGLRQGSYAYGVTFVTPNGETTMGPLGNWVTMVQLPLIPPSLTSSVMTPYGPGSLTPATYRWAATFLQNRNSQLYETTLGPPSPPFVLSGGGVGVQVTNVPLGPAGSNVIYRKYYRSKDGGPFLYAGTLQNNFETFFIDDGTTGSSAAPPSTNTTTGGPYTNEVPLSDIPRGPAGTTQRKIYRQASGSPIGDVLGYVATIADNTTTTHLDRVDGPGGPPPTTNTAAGRAVALSNIPTGPPDVTHRKIYRTAAGGSTLGYVLSIADNVTTVASDQVPDANRLAAPPTTSTALANRVQLSQIPLGAATVTGRKIYRTPANNATLKLLTTLADNTTTSYLDALSDSTLGASPSGSDTSGLTQPSGNVPPGASSLIVAGTGGFLAGGGWAVIGNGQQVIRYTGLTGNALTGIPSSGVGAITASISYNSTATQAPQLMGIPSSGEGAIRYPIRPGDDVNLWIQVDDPTAQAALALLLSSAAAGAHDGIIEDIIQDRRLSATECRARGRAHLEQRTDLQLTVRYQSRDTNTRSGRLITVNILASPWNLSATFMIQTVTIRQFSPTLLPTFEVEASSVKFSFEDLLRRMRDRGADVLPTGG